jgi:hypothetical protein
VLQSEAAFDAEVTVGDAVIRWRGHIYDLPVLDVEFHVASHATERQIVAVSPHRPPRTHRAPQSRRRRKQPGPGAAAGTDLGEARDTKRQDFQHVVRRLHVVDHGWLATATVELTRHQSLDHLAESSADGMADLASWEPKVTEDLSTVRDGRAEALVCRIAHYVPTILTWSDPLLLISPRCSRR